MRNQNPGYSSRVAHAGNPDPRGAQGVRGYPRAQPNTGKPFSTHGGQGSGEGRGWLVPNPGNRELATLVTCASWAQFAKSKRTLIFRPLFFVFTSRRSGPLRLPPPLRDTFSNIANFGPLGLGWDHNQHKKAKKVPVLTQEKKAKLGFFRGKNDNRMTHVEISGEKRGVGGCARAQPQNRTCAT
jgi:hypothetical protein